MKFIKNFNNPRKVYIISEIGINHNGCIDTALQLINESKKAGADAVKFQKRDLKSLYTDNSINNPNNQEWNIEVLVNQLKKVELSYDEYHIINEECKKLNIDLIITPFDKVSVDFITTLDIVAFKNASCNMTNYDLIDYMGKHNLPIIISTGMWTDEEINNCTQYFKMNNYEYYLLLSNSTYPCPFEDININYISTLKKYSKIVGYSGHERGIFIPIAAVALGARIIEKHITFDKNQKGLDHKASNNIQEWNEMINNIRLLEKALGNNKIVNQAEFLAKQSFCMSPYSTRDISKGEVLDKNMFIMRAPGKGILPNELDKYLGTKVQHNIPKDSCISSGYFDSTISINSWNLNKFKRNWGVKCRFGDYPQWSVLSAPVYEFHCSHEDMYNSITGISSNTSQLIIHAPETINTMLVDICAEDNSFQLNKSLDLIQHTINRTIEISKDFVGKPKLVIHLGGMCLDPVSNNNVYIKRKTLLDRAIKNFSKLNYDKDQIEILPENLPPKPWYFGGEWSQYGFMYEDDICKFCDHFGLNMTYDVCHAKLYCNHCNCSLDNFTKKVKPYISHLHISDAIGVNGEGIQIDEGEIDFDELINELDDKNFTWVTEIWSGHTNRGKKTYDAMKKLERFDSL